MVGPRILLRTGAVKTRRGRRRRFVRRTERASRPVPAGPWRYRGAGASCACGALLDSFPVVGPSCSQHLMCGARLGLLLMAIALSARAGPPAPDGPLKTGSQSIDIALGTSGVAAGYSRDLSGWLELGARADWQSWSYQDTVSLVALGARAPLRARVASPASALPVTIEVASGARRLRRRVREAGCDCVAARGALRQDQSTKQRPYASPGGARLGDATDEGWGPRSAPAPIPERA